MVGYTKEELKQLKAIFKQKLSEDKVFQWSWSFTLDLRKSPQDEKSYIKSRWSCFYPILYTIKYEDLPLHLNRRNTDISTIASWRLNIGK